MTGEGHRDGGEPVGGAGVSLAGDVRGLQPLM
jgi:hypothetical protein